MLASAAFAAETDNPEYTGWSKFKPGTTVTMKSQSETKMQGMPDPMKSEMTMTTKLVDMKPDAATVETTTKMVMMGNESTMPAQSRTIKAKTDATGTPTAPPDMKNVKEGTEKVEVGGKSYDCKTKEYDTEANGSKTHMKVWTSDEVPGGTVKMESTTTGQADTKMTMTLVDVKTP
jgi:hypothetical protein